jgi:hypothetical protein
LGNWRPSPRPRGPTSTLGPPADVGDVPAELAQSACHRNWARSRGLVCSPGPGAVLTNRTSVLQSTSYDRPLPGRPGRSRNPSGTLGWSGSTLGR